ncbi:MAG: hypothetical protein KDD44_04980, partial [Bdellovibrionales bacterium]|nr:hypothetical protein [Bdellovibrionales bacterium]
RGFFPDGVRRIIAARATGIFQTNFPSGAPKATTEGGASPAEQPGEPLTRSIGESHVVVIGDSDLLATRFSAQVVNVLGRQVARLRNDNFSLVQNILEQLAGSTELISIRSRGTFSRPFEYVENIRRAAALRWRSEETRLQEKLQQANARLQQLQSTTQGDGSSAVFGQALMNEIRAIQAERAETQRRLREVRRQARQEIERLGTVLFLLNTFFVPIVLIFTATLVAVVRRRRTK